MVSELRKGFDRYWSDRVPGLVEYARYVLNNDTDFNHTLRLFITFGCSCSAIQGIWPSSMMSWCVS